MQARPLEGILVVETGPYLCAPLVGQHLRHLGAHVIRVQRPGGADSVWRREVEKALAEGKTTRTIDLKSVEGRDEVHAFVHRASVVITGHGPGVAARLGLDAAACHRVNEDVVHVSLPGFAGDEGATMDAYEPVIMAAAGIFRDMGVNRQLTGCPASYSPLPLASAFGSVAAALAIVAALHAKACGVASPRISIEVPLASALLDTLVHNAVETELPPQYRSRRLRTLEAEVAGSAPVDYHRLLELCDPFYSHYQCADGRPFYLVAPSHLRHQQRALAVLGIDASDLVDRAQPYSDGADPRLHLGLGAAQIGDEAAPALRRRMQAAFLRRASFDWERLFGLARVPGIAHRTTAEWMASSHAIESGLAACGPGGVLSPGPAAWVLEFPEAVARTKAPRAASQPVADAPATATPSAQRGGCAGGGWLSGVRVLDLSNVIAGPTIGSMLARYGADVTKVDHPQPTYAPDVTVVYGLAANRGKRSVLLDITDTSAPPGEPTGRQALEALVARVDLVIVNCTAASLERLGLSPQELHAINPDAILVRFDAYGGPIDGRGDLAGYLGYDDCLQAALGIMERFGGGMGRVEEHAHVGTIDVVAGVGGALAAAAALLHRRRRRVDSLACPIVARASLASLGMIVQYPFCCGTREQLEAEAAASQCRLGPDCLGEHALLRCYAAADSEWLLMCASLQPFHSVSADRRRRIVAALAAADPVLADALVCAAEAGPDALAGMGEAELQASLTRAFKTSHGAAAWAERLRRAGIRGVTVLRSIHQLHREHSCADVAVPDGPTFQFVADDAHPVGGRVSMFAPCGVRVRGVDPGVVLPLTPAPRYGEHTTAVLAEVGVSSADLLARGAAAVCWSTQYLPGRAPQGTLAQPMLLSSGEDGPFTTAQRDRCTDSVVEKCPVCLGHSDRRVQLSCSHVLCSPCAQRCDAAGHQRCPICRHPHLLDPKLLGQRSAEWRRRYHGWRAGSVSGSIGEVSSISAPRSLEHKYDSHSRFAGDLLLARTTAGATSDGGAGRLSKSK